MKSRSLFVSALLLVQLLGLSGCAVVDWLTYKLPVSQGNIIEQKDVDKLKPGMNREQVVFVLGEPLARSSFRDDHWEYVFTSRAGRESLTSKRITVHFANEALAKVSGEGFLIPEGLGGSAAAPTPEQPAQEQPAQEQPAQEQPAQEQPAQDQPAQDQPAEPTQP